MFKSQCITKLVLVTVMGTLLCISAEGLAMEQAIVKTDSQQLSLENNTGGMSVYRYKKVSSLSDMALLPENKTHTISGKEPKKVKRSLLPKDEMTRVSDKLLTATQWILKYLTFEDSHRDDSTYAFSLKPMLNTERSWKKEFDYNISLEVGAGQDPKDLALTAVRLSTQGFSTHLEAVYDCRNDALAFILSTRHINAHLMEGMRLEFQVSPTQSGGAVLMMLSF